MDIKRLIGQVKRNCDIADAQAWGYYSVCGLLMRLRDLYRSERSLMPWDPIPREAMGEWIAGREQSWEAFASEALRPIEVDGEFLDPFQVDGINTALDRYGLVYGGGYALFGKPTFFLARLDRTAEIYDYRVYYAGQELCRDLSSPAAMLQGRCIFLRLDRLTALLWEKFLELKTRRFGGALSAAFSSYGVEGTEPVTPGLRERIASIAGDVANILVRHEIGEAIEDEWAEQWHGLLAAGTDKRTELYLRGIKDLLADTSPFGPLKQIIDRQETGLFGFYVILLDSIRKELFPEVVAAHQAIAESGDWSVIEEARASAYRKALRLRDCAVALAGDGIDAVSRFLEESRKGGWTVC